MKRAQFALMAPLAALVGLIILATTSGLPFLAIAIGTCIILVGLIPTAMRLTGRERGAFAIFPVTGLF